MGENHTILSRRAEWFIGIVVGVIGQYALRIAGDRCFLGGKGKEEKE